MPGNPALAVLGKAQSAESPQAVAALEVQYGVQTRTGMWGQYVQALSTGGPGSLIQLEEIPVG
jgi:hypothetical protein